MTRYVLVYFVLFVGLMGCRTVPETTESLSVATEELLSNIPNDEYPSIAVVPFINTETGETDSLGAYIAGDVVFILSNRFNDRVQVVERERMIILLSELEISLLSGLVSDDDAKRIGEMAGADYILIGETLPLEEMLQLNLRIVNVERGTVRGAAKAIVPFTDEYRIAADTNAGSENGSQAEISDSRDISGRFLPGVSDHEQVSDIPRISVSGEVDRLDPVDLPWSRLPIVFFDPPGNTTDDRPSSDILSVQIVTDGNYLYFAYHTAGPIENDETWYQINVYGSQEFDKPDGDINIRFANGAASSMVRSVPRPDERQTLWEGRAWLFENGAVGAVPLSSIPWDLSGPLYLSAHVYNGTHEGQILNIRQITFSQEASLNIYTHPYATEVPYRTISIDGDPSDWDGVQPIFSESDAGDGANRSLMSIYAASDPSFLYLRMDVRNDSFSTDDRQYYGYHLQSNDSWDVGDLEFMHVYRNGRWRINVNRYKGEGQWEFRIPFSDTFGAVDQVAELKIPHELITNPLYVLVEGYIYIDDVGETSNSDRVGIKY